METAQSFELHSQGIILHNNGRKDFRLTSVVLSSWFHKEEYEHVTGR